MKVNPVCSKCKTDLEIKDNYVSTAVGTVVMEVVPCGNMGCYDCSSCDGVLKLANTELKNQNKKLREEIQTLKAKLST